MKSLYVASILFFTTMEVHAMVGIFGFGRWGKMRLDDSARFLKKSGINMVVLGRADRRKIKSLKSSGIKVFVSIGIFSGKADYNRYKSARPIDRYGSVVKNDRWYYGLCPTSRVVIKKRLRTIKRVINNYNIDGIFLDTIRYPGLWEVGDNRRKLVNTCFCDRCISLFKKRYNINKKINPSIILNTYYKEWIEFKKENILSFIKQAREITDKYKKLLGAFVVPFMSGKLGDIINNIYAQDIERIDRVVDIISPMLYHRMLNRDIKWIKRYLSYIKPIAKHSRVVPIFQCYDISRRDFSIMLDISKRQDILLFMFSRLKRYQMDMIGAIYGRY